MHVRIVHKMVVFTSIYVMKFCIHTKPLTNFMEDKKSKNFNIFLVAFPNKDSDVFDCK